MRAGYRRAPVRKWWASTPSIGSAFNTFKRKKKPLHFRNIAPGQTRPKGIRRKYQIPLSNQQYYRPHLTDWAVGGYNTGVIAEAIATSMVRGSCFISQLSQSYQDLPMATYTPPVIPAGTLVTVANGTVEPVTMYNSDYEVGYIVQDDHLYRAENNIWVELTMANGTTLRGWDVNRDTHKYRSVWDKICEAIVAHVEITPGSDTVTFEDIYRRVTGHVMFNMASFEPETTFCNADTFHFLDKHHHPISFRRNWEYQSAAGVRAIQEKMDWEPYPQFIITSYFSHKWGLWVAAVQHKTDRDGPCMTCREFIEKYPVQVEEIIL